MVGGFLFFNGKYFMYNYVIRNYNINGNKYQS